MDRGCITGKGLLAASDYYGTNVFVFIVFCEGIVKFAEQGA